MGNLRQKIWEELKKSDLDNLAIEKKLCFKEGAITDYINADWVKLDKTFSPLKLCKYLSIPIEEYHYGYFIDFDEEKYTKYMEEYEKSLPANKIKETLNTFKCPNCGHIYNKIE